MKYVLTGAAGNITGLLAKQLIASGGIVTVIGRNEVNLQGLIHAGVQPAIGSLEDVDLLKRTFEGADAVYTMIPPNPVCNDQIGFHEQLGYNYAAAIESAGVQHIVNLSSMGAHLPVGGGLPSGLHRVEKILNNLNANVRHLRAGYSYLNLLSNIGLIKQLGFMGSNFSADPNSLPIAAPIDIAAAAAEELLLLTFTGHSIRYVTSDETGTNEIAFTIGNAIGKKDLPWVQLEDEQVMEALLQFGFSNDAAAHIVQTGAAIDKGILLEDYHMNRPAKLGVVRLNDFAHQFANIYHA